MTPLLLAEFTASSCLGRGANATLTALLEQRSGLKRCDFETVHIDTYIGEVPGVDAQRLPANLQKFDCRNNRLAELALQQDGFLEAVQAVASRWGRRRVGVFIGTSTSGILQTELAYRARDPKSGALPPGFEYAGTHNSFSVADYVRQRCRLEGPAVAVSSACASSAKVFGSARRMIEAGLIDAALVGGTDSLCLTTLYGFHSLQLSSAAPCRPFDVARDGISIGEAAAFAVLERQPDRFAKRFGAAPRNWRIERCLPHVRTAPRRLGRQARDARRARRCRPRTRRHRLHQFAWHRHAEQRSRRKPGDNQHLRTDHSLQFDQGGNRPYLGGGRRSGGDDLRSVHHRTD